MLLPLAGAAVRFVASSGYSLYDERKFLPALSAFLFYYLYNIAKARERDIVNMFTAIALCIFGIQVFQVIYPEMAVFGIYDDEIRQSRHAIAEMRNGIYRFRLETYFFTLFCLYYYWNRLCAKPALRDIVLFCVFLTSTYLYLTRQIMIASVVTLACSYFFIKKTKAKIFSVLMIGLLGFVLLQYSDELFRKLFAQTKTEINAGNIRVITAGFYWEKICEGPIAFLFGNGHPVQLSKWSERVLHPSDIGLIGEMFHYGALWIVFYFYTVYLVLAKHGKKLPLYIKLFVFGTFTNSIMIFPYRNGGEYFVWATVLYIASLYIVRYRTLIRENNNE